MPTISTRHPDHDDFLLPAGPASALLIHGFLGSPRDMRPLAQELAAAGVTTRGVRMPGFGQEMEHLRSVRAADWLNAARAAWEETRDGAAHTTLIGFSMGGAIAMQLAAEAGLAPDHLILLAPHWKFADRRAIFLPVGKYFIREFRPFGRPDLDDPATRRLVAELAPGADLDDPAVRHQFRDLFTVPTHALDELRRVNWSAGRAARRISAPTTILQGLQDPTSLPAFSRQLATRIGANLIEFPGDHLIVDPARPSWETVRDLVVKQATSATAP